jgi:hypothetical protein
VKFFGDGGQIDIDRYIEQQALLADLCFAGLAEANSLVVASSCVSVVILKSFSVSTASRCAGLACCCSSSAYTLAMCEMWHGASMPASAQSDPRGKFRHDVGNSYMSRRWFF